MIWKLPSWNFLVGWILGLLKCNKLTSGLQNYGHQSLLNLQKSLENENLKKSAAILSCWTSLPNYFICLKKIAFALLSAFGSTYCCEQIFSHMKAVLNPQRSRLTENSENCVKLKSYTQYVVDIEQLAKIMQGLP